MFYLTLYQPCKIHQLTECSKPPISDHATNKLVMNDHDLYLPSAKVMYTCDSGYRTLPPGISIITCGNDGNWTWDGFKSCFSGKRKHTLVYIDKQKC